MVMDLPLTLLVQGRLGYLRRARAAGAQEILLLQFSAFLKCRVVLVLVEELQLQGEGLCGTEVKSQFYHR